MLYESGTFFQKFVISLLKNVILNEDSRECRVTIRSIGRK